MKRVFLPYLFALLICLCVPISGQSKAIHRHIWNLQNADIHAVISAVAKETGKNFIIDPRVQGKISIISSKPINNKAVYQVFLSALQVLGYSAIPSGNFTKIVPDESARTLATPIADLANQGQGDELVVRVIPIQYVSAIQLVPILRPMMPQWSNIAAYSPSNVVIISGRAANVSRMADLIHRVDVANTSQIEIIPVQHATASKIVTSIKALQDAQRATGKISNIALSADDESNKILLSGSPKERLKMRVLILQLDSASMGGGNTQVIHLNYLSAKKLAPILAGVAHSSYLAEKNGKSVTVTGPNKDVAIKADADSNSIIISAPTNIMRTLLSVIHHLDTHPSQILVEAVIAQVDENLVHQLGVTWGTQAGDTGDDAVGNTTLGVQTGVGIIKKGSLRILINALNNDTSADILSTPSIVVLDNQKAEIKVGKNVGIQNRSYAVADNDNSTAPYNTFTRKDVALVLDVTPHISPDTTIQLKIKQRNDTLENPTNPGDNPIINTNSIATSVLVKNGSILVLGGLISHDLARSTSKIPILGDIPLLGEAFKYHNNSVEKKNLMVFIRPIILHANKNATTITNNRYKYIRKQQLLKAEGINLITNINEPPLLKPLKKPVQGLPAPFSSDD